MSRRFLRLIYGPLLLNAGFAFGQASALDFQRVAPKPPPQVQRAATLPAPGKGNFADETPVLSKLGGIVLLSAPEQVRPNGWPGVAGVKCAGEGLISNPKLASRLAVFIGKPATFGKLQEICAEIVRFYRENNRPVADAQLPEQNVSKGVVQILVVEGHVGVLVAEDQKWFPESRILGAIRAKKGDPIESNELLDDLNWLNRNPFRRSEVLFRKGASPGETDVIIKTTDRLPFRPYIGYDNFGTDLTGNNRLQAGFTWGNAFGLDQNIAYQFSVAPDPKDFTAHAASWDIPLPWRHVLGFYGSYGRSRPDVAGVDFDEESLQLGALYTIPLPSLQGIKHEVSLGAEFKRANNDLIFSGINIFASDTEIFQARLSYLAREFDSKGATTAQASIYYSPGGFDGENSAAAFEHARAFAEPDYFYGRVTLQRTLILPWKLSLVGTAVGQLSNANLVASEQLSLGGSTTVRGYEESIANGDQGWLGSLELYSPSVMALRRIRSGAPEDELKFLVFFDAGGVSNVHLLPGEPSYRGLAGVGAGLRYNISTRLSVRFDYGWRLQGIQGLQLDDSRAYLSVSMSY